MSVMEEPIDVDAQDTTNNHSPDTTGKKRKASKKKTSEVWTDFERLKDEHGNFNGEAKCIHCKQIYAHKSENGTTHLRRHRDIYCQKKPRHDKKQKKLTFQGFENRLLPVKFDQEVCRKALARMIIIDELPFKFVEKEGFKSFCGVMQPLFRLMSRVTIARDCLSMYALEKKLLKEELANCGRVCLTTDGWTSIQNINYLCLTAHYIDKNWVLKKKILNFCLISSHKGSVLCQIIEECLNQWSIDKVMTITVDNASSNDTAVGLLRKKLFRKNGLVLDGEYLHVRCSAHVLNLIVKDGVDEVKESVSRIRNLVKYIRSSPHRKLQFESCCDQEHLTSARSLCLDVITRWNSTYLMLDSALKFVKAFERLEEQEPQISRDLIDGFPKEDDWENARVLVMFLATFYDMTKRLSGSKYTTSNLFLHEVSAVEEVLASWTCVSQAGQTGNVLDIENEQIDKYSLLTAMSIKMKEKFKKYWGGIEKINVLLLVALVLDPRYKIKYVRFNYENYYSAEEIKSLVKKISDALNRLYVCYKKMDDTMTSNSSQGASQTSSAISTGTSSNDSMSSMALSRATSKRFLFHKKQQGQQGFGVKSEIERYLEEDLEIDGNNEVEFDILGWWRRNSFRFKILSQITKDVLAIPVSTVASESAFSTWGRILDPFRSSFTPKVVECLICTQDWLRASPNPVSDEESYEQLEDLESAMINGMEELSFNNDK